MVNIKYSLYIAGIVMLFLFSCKNEKFPGYSVTENGLYYKLHVIGFQEVYPKVGDLLTVDVIFKTETDSVIHKSAKKIVLSSPPYHGSIEEGLLMLSIGDSASYKLLADSFYIKGLGIPLPHSIAHGSYLTAGIKMISIKPKTEDYIMNNALIDEYEFKDMDELSMLSDYLKENNIHVTPTSSGLYLIKEKETSGRIPQRGHGVKINYSGSFLDGRIFDSTTSRGPFEFGLGVSDQVIPAIEQALYLMHEGEKAKIIVPSFLAFGEKGSSSGIVPAYTPVIYEVELLKVN